MSFIPIMSLIVHVVRIAHVVVDASAAVAQVRCAHWLARRGTCRTHFRDCFESVWFMRNTNTLYVWAHGCLTPRCFIHIYIIFVYICIYLFISIYIYIGLDICLYIYIYIYIYVFGLFLFLYMFLYMFIYIYMFI